MRKAAALALALALAMVAASPTGVRGADFTPAHQKPGPAAERLFFRAFHVDIAPASLQRGDMDFYAFSLKTEAAKALQSGQGVRIYQAPATSLSLVLNPAPAPQGELNPFSIREVRSALQYAINREFVAQEIYKGLAEPMVTYVSPFDYDYLTILPLLREYNITYDPELAKETVTKAMTAAGATLQSGVWNYGGKPIRVKFIIRTEDERRDVGDTVRVELEKLGFQVLPTYQTFAPAVRTVYGTDPQLFEWHLYTEGWGRGSAERYDYGNANQMAAPWLGNMPGWQETGFWQYKNDRADELGQKLFRGDFASAEERATLYGDLARTSIEDSVRIWVATVMNNFPASTNLVGVSEDMVSGPKSIWTLREAYLPGKDTLTVGSVWVWTERTTWNPIGGFGDVYSVDIWTNIHDPPLARHPFTGIPVSLRAQYNVETAGPGGKLPVPQDAFLWDAAARQFRSVGPGTSATSKVTFDYSRYFQSKWHHGQPITMADVVYSIYQSFDMAYAENKSRIEVALATTSRPYLDTIRGFRVVDDSHLEVYADYWHFVPDYIAEYASPSGLSMPWEVLAAMDRLVFEERRAAYSATAAERFGVPWLNLVTDRDVRLVRRVLRDFRDSQYLPQEAFQVGNRSLVTPQEAQARYQATLDWIDKYTLGVISNGPFKLVRFDPPAQFAELEAFRDPSYPFKPGDWFKGASPRIQFVAVDTDPVQIGAPSQTKVQLQGPGEMGLRYQLFNPVTRQVVEAGDAQATGGGTFQVSLGAERTAAMAPGLYQLYLTAYSNAISSPSQQRVNLEAVVAAQVTPTGPGPTPTPEGRAAGGCTIGGRAADAAPLGALGALVAALAWAGRRRRGQDAP